MLSERAWGGLEKKWSPSPPANKREKCPSLGNEMNVGGTKKKEKKGNRLLIFLTEVAYPARTMNDHPPIRSAPPLLKVPVRFSPVWKKKTQHFYKHCSTSCTSLHPSLPSCHSSHKVSHTTPGLTKTRPSWLAQGRRNCAFVSPGLT